MFLSNDATAVVLTPAVYAATRAARVKEPLPYLFICAFIANAASFVLPISNPANLVVYGGAHAAAAAWLRDVRVAFGAVDRRHLSWCCGWTQRGRSARERGRRVEPAPAARRQAARRPALR